MLLLSREIAFKYFGEYSAKTNAFLIVIRPINEMGIINSLPSGFNQRSGLIVAQLLQRPKETNQAGDLVLLVKLKIVEPFFGFLG